EELERVGCVGAIFVHWVALAPANPPTYRLARNCIHKMVGAGAGCSQNGGRARNLQAVLHFSGLPFCS
ncbi:hypothetical protein NDU88_005930, partial [Pleurodeles waltl]